MYVFIIHIPHAIIIQSTTNNNHNSTISNSDNDINTACGKSTSGTDLRLII